MFVSADRISLITNALGPLVVYWLYLSPSLKDLGSHAADFPLYLFLIDLQLFFLCGVQSFVVM